MSLVETIRESVLGIEALGSYLTEAKWILGIAPPSLGSSPLLSDEAEDLRWFPTPQEV